MTIFTPQDYELAAYKMVRVFRYVSKQAGTLSSFEELDANMDAQRIIMQCRLSLHSELLDIVQMSSSGVTH